MLTQDQAASLRRLIMDYVADAASIIRSEDAAAKPNTPRSRLVNYLESLTQPSTYDDGDSALRMAYEMKLKLDFNGDAVGYGHVQGTKVSATMPNGFQHTCSDPMNPVRAIKLCIIECHKQHLLFPEN